MATNQGAYEYNRRTSEIHLLPHTSGQNWYVKQIDSQVFIGNDMSTMLVEQNGSIQSVPGALNSTCIVEASINGQEVLVEASYAELRIWKKQAGIWKLSHNVQDFMRRLSRWKLMVLEQSGLHTCTMDFIVSNWMMICIA